MKPGSRDRCGPSARPRFAFYTHDTFGMGHVRRCLNLIEALARRRPEAAILLITGSPAVDVLKARPQNVDVVKLPTIAPTGSADARPPHLPIGTEALITIRSKTVAVLLDAFAPDVLMVDNFALGARRELQPALAALRRGATRTVLGLRDVVDDPEVLRVRWAKQGIDRALRNLYDRILVFGEREVFDAGLRYGLDAATAAKLEHCGYVARPPAEPGSDPFGRFGIEQRPRILATVGGGGDGLPLLTAFLGAMEQLPELSALVLSGPLQGAAERRVLAARAAALAPRIVLKPFVDDPTALMAEADLVVSMAGYNTVAELVGCGARSLLVPRNWRYGEHATGPRAGVEMEQPIRAQLLADAGLASMLPPEDLSPETLAEAIRAALARRRPVRSPALRLDGAERAAEILSDLIDAREMAGAD